MSSPQQRRGFTLIEILVVIAIIGILMAILVPVLNKARETAYKGTCGANIKSLCFALNEYAQDEGGWYISSVLPVGVDTGFSDGNEFFAASIGPYMGLAAIPPMQDVTMQDVSDTKMWACPTALRKWPNGKLPTENIRCFGVSRPLYTQNPVSQWRVHEDEIEIPSKTILFGESVPGGSSGWNRAINVGSETRYSHAKETSNWGFFDGHVSSLLKDEIPVSASSTTPQGSTPYVGITFWSGKAP
mgnify:CR=1 FL=1